MMMSFLAAAANALQNPEVISQGALDSPVDGSGPSLWLPVQAAQGVEEIDFAFYFILAICTFFFFLIVGLGILFVIKYRKRPGYVPKPSPHHSLALEVTWSVIPIILCVFMFWYGFEGYMDGRTMPDDAEQIDVVAAKWNWTFGYSNGVQSPELHLPVDEPTVVTMRSKDVIHSFFIPAFRTKLDVVPGKYSKLWFTPTKVGEYQLFCTEYCGTGHSGMGARVFVHTREDYDAKIAEMNVWPPPDLTKEQAGELLFRQQCVACHQLNAKVIGPPIAEFYGKERTFSNADPVIADENYVRESILNPAAKIVEGYPNNMTSFQGLLNDDKVDTIIAYIKSVSNQ